jgi:hypothetical protein
MTENKTAKTPTDDGHVAHVYLFDKTGRPMVAWDNAKDIKLGDKLYAAPKREWVGLTDEEVSEIIDREIGFNSCWGPEEAFARAVEEKLKEKNHG